MVTVARRDLKGRRSRRVKLLVGAGKGRGAGLDLLKMKF